MGRPEGNLRCCAYSPCGRFFAWASPEQCDISQRLHRLQPNLTRDRVSIVDASVGHVVTSLPVQNVYELGFSPLGTFVITWQRPSKSEDGEGVKNLKVWKVHGEERDAEENEQLAVGRFVQKSQTGWNLQYTYDEQYCARVVSNEVQIFESGDLTTVWNKIRVEGVVDFAVSPGRKHSIAVFIPERKVRRWLAHPKRD